MNFTLVNRNPYAQCIYLNIHINILLLFHLVYLIARIAHLHIQTRPFIRIEYKCGTESGDNEQEHEYEHKHSHEIKKTPLRIKNMIHKTRNKYTILLLSEIYLYVSTMKQVPITK